MNGRQFWELYQSYGDVYRQEVLEEEVEEIDEVTGGGLIKGSSTSYAGGTTYNRKTGDYETNLSAAQKRRELYGRIVQKQVGGEINPKPGTDRGIHAQELAGFRKPQHYRGGDVPRRDPSAITSREGISPEGTPSGLAMTPRARAEGRAKSLAARGGKYTKAANRIRRELETNKNLNASYDYDLYDIVLEHLLDEGFADTFEDAQVLMANMSEQWIDSIVEASEDSEVAAELARLRGQMKTALQKGDKATIQSISKRLADLQPAARAKTGAALRENAETLAEYDRRRKAAELAGNSKLAAKYISIMSRIQNTMRNSQNR